MKTQNDKSGFSNGPNLKYGLNRLWILKEKSHVHIRQHLKDHGNFEDSGLRGWKILWAKPHIIATWEFWIFDPNLGTWTLDFGFWTL